MDLACASMLFSTNSATALSGLLWESAMMRIAFQSSPILSLPLALRLRSTVLYILRDRPRSGRDAYLYELNRSIHRALRQTRRDILLSFCCYGETTVHRPKPCIVKWMI